MNIYLDAARVVADYEKKNPSDGVSKQPFTCNLLDREVRFEYQDLFDLGPANENEDDLWHDEPKFRKERRLLMLCLARAIKESGGL